MIELPAHAEMKDYQRYVYELEKLHGWLDVDLIHNCFLMGEEVGELFKAIRKHLKFYEQENAPAKEREATLAHCAEEIVDVLNYLLALANRLEIDVETAFKAKNEKNQKRTWGGPNGDT